jgi:enoyl-CoA hydratase/carnithine racemase
MKEQTRATESRIVDHVGIITLNQPETFNALSGEMIKGIGESLACFEKDTQIRVVLIESSGDYFCTGANLKEAKEKRKSHDAWSAFISDGLDVFRSLEKSPLPVVAAVQGLCLAGGLELSLCCDVVFAGKSTKIGDQHSQYGLLPGWGGSQRLPRIVGLRAALDLLYSARWLKADEALRMGLVSYVVDDDLLVAQALEYCNALAERCPRGLTKMKRLVRDGLDMPLSEGLDLERTEVGEYIFSDDAEEGLNAFEERRKPIFR